MTRHSRSIAAPKFRHLFPVAPDITFRTPAGYAPTRPASMTLTTFAYVGNPERLLPAVLPNKFRTAGSLWVTVNDIPFPNEYAIIGYEMGQPIWGWNRWTYDPDTNILMFVQPPANGTVIAVYEMPEQGDDYMGIAVPRHVLIQGARGFPLKKAVAGEPTPMPTKFPDHEEENEIEILTLPLDGPDGQFLGGFRCTLEILTPCVHGQARIGYDHRTFEYRPNFGYTGRDSFSYRVRTVFGQESDAACVQLYVGI